MLNILAQWISTIYIEFLRITCIGGDDNSRAEDSNKLWALAVITTVKMTQKVNIKAPH